MYGIWEPNQFPDCDGNNDVLSTGSKLHDYLNPELGSVKHGSLNDTLFCNRQFVNLKRFETLQCTF